MSQAGTPSVISTYAKQLQDQDEKGSMNALFNQHNQAKSA
jgi:hypothetical protein